LAIVIDAWSRRVVGWSIGEQMNSDLVLGALNMALQQRRPEHVIHHSDSKNIESVVSRRPDPHSDRPIVENLVPRSVPGGLTHTPIDHDLLSFPGPVGHPGTLNGEVSPRRYL
jgi:transposase InsO family protein